MQGLGPEKAGQGAHVDAGDSGLSPARTCPPRGVLRSTTQWIFGAFSKSVT